MSTELKKTENEFNHGLFGRLTTFTNNEGEVYFVGDEVTKALGYARSRDAIAQHCKGAVKHRVGVVTGITSNGTPATQEVEKNIIPERDLYRLVMRSKKPEAEKFEEWVVGEVLPTIRKNGSYSVKQSFNIPTTYAEALMLAAKQAEQIEKQEKTLAIQAPKVEFADQLLKSTNAIDLGTAVKAMNLNYGRNTFFAKLRDLKILDLKNMPYQRFIDYGYFTILETSFVHPKTNDRQMTFKTMITAKGQKFVLKELEKRTAIKNGLALRA